MIEKLAKAIKRSNKKKNVNVTLGLIIGFLLSSGTIYGYTTDGKDIFIKESKEYNNDTTLKHDGGQLISTWNGASSNSITLDAGEHNLTLIHKTDTPYIIKDLVGIENVKSLYSSVIADRGNLTIKAKKIALNSEIFVKDISPIDDTSIEGSSLRNGITVIGDTTTDNETKAVLEAEEININVKGNGILSGIALFGNISFNAKAEIKATNFILNVEAKDFAQGIDIARGTVNIVSKNTKIFAKTEENSNSYRAEGIGIIGGYLNLQSEDVYIDAYGAKNVLTTLGTSRVSGISTYNTSSRVNIESTKNIIIKAKSEVDITKEGSFVEAFGIMNGGEVNINSNNLIIDTECANGIAHSIATSGGTTIINSKNTILRTAGKSQFPSEEVSPFSELRTAGISTMFNGITEINGGLEMYQIGKKEDILSIRATAKGIVTINKNNENVAVKINDKMLADGGTINLNLNGANSYFRGQASIVAYNDNIPPSFPSDEFNGLVGNINLGISNEAVWKNEGDSKITNLTFNNGIIDMTYESGKQTIEIDKISGNNGRIVMDISPDDANQKGNKTDYIKISDGGNQTHYIETGEKSILALKDYDFTNNILIGEAAKDVILKGNYFANIENIYEYNLDLESQEKGSTNNNWYVTGMKEREGTVIEGVMDDLSLHYMNAGLARMEADTLHKRLGDIRDLKEGAGAWARVTSGQMESHKDGYFKNDYTMIQAGIDKSEPSETGIWTTGLAVQRREGKADFRNGDGKNGSMGIALYKSWVGNDNQYLDLVGKYSHLKNEYKTYNVKNEKMEAKYHTNAGTLSLEYGKRLSKEKWYVQPHAQMTYTWIEGKNYLTTSSIRAEQKDINSLIGKAGIYAGYDFGRSSHFVKAGVLHEFMGDYGVTIKGADASVTKNVDGKDSWIEIGIGGDIKVGKTDSMNVYYELEKTFGGDFETNWQATLGMRYKF